MPTVTTPSSRSSNSLNQADSSVFIRFAEDAPAGAKVLRRFVDPVAAIAVEQTADGAQLEIVFSGDAKAIRQNFNASVTVETEIARVSWRTGQAMIIASPADAQALMSAVIDFAFYEDQLRKLEQAITPHQARADADVALSYNIRRSDQAQWDRLYQTMETLYRLRLAFARLEPHLGTADQSLPIEARRCFNRLLIKSRMESRLEAFSDRLEAIEDLYEGACDRITDYRNYRTGSLLEMGIIVLLLLEVILLLVQAFHGK